MSYEIKNRAGFSLLEILVAMAIMAILGGIMVGQYISYTQDARLLRIQSDLAELDSALIRYQIDNFMLPTSEQGLKALTSKPHTSPRPKNYPNSGYLASLSKDPWGNDYQYASPGEFGRYDIYSLGQDGMEGGEGINTDLGNWNIAEAIRNHKNAE